MRMERWGGLAVLVLTAVIAGSCGKKPAPEMPAPQPGPTTQPQRNNGTEGPATTDPDAAMRAAIASRRAALEDRIQFGYDRSDLTTESQTTLRTKLEALRAEPTIRLRIEGHADERGSVEYNLALGLRRAHAARDFLTGFGVDGSRLEVASFGEDRPLDRGTTEAAYARNRRDEFVIIGGNVTGR